MPDSAPSSFSISDGDSWESIFLTLLEEYSRTGAPARLPATKEPHVEEARRRLLDPGLCRTTRQSLLRREKRAGGRSSAQAIPRLLRKPKPTSALQILREVTGSAAAQFRVEQTEILRAGDVIEVAATNIGKTIWLSEFFGSMFSYV